MEDTCWPENAQTNVHQTGKGEQAMDVSQFSLEGQVALVTGGSRGIGEATAVRFARAGADVAVTSRRLPALEEVAEKVRKEGRRALAVETHVGRMDQLQPLVDKVVAEFGKVDILVNNAGTNFFAPAIDMDEKGWDSVMNLDLKGLFFLSQACARVMREHGGGKIINISSTSGYRVQVPTGHYSIAKAGVIMATKVMALEWAPFNIRVNCIAPGAIDTRLYDATFALMPEEESRARKKESADRIPLKRVGAPREIADAIIFLASDAASYVTGQSFAVDGGSLLR
jgi:NAD(P)-dependent dehydrogenase (short-subunit alcohol dehydrogenase family)